MAWRVVGSLAVAAVLMGLAAVPVRMGLTAGQEAERSLRILSPGPSGVAVHNQRQGAAPYTVALPDAQATVRPGELTVRGLAIGMRNVAVVVPADGPWHMVQPGADGGFAVTVSIPDETGPLPLEVYAWDSPPGDPLYRVELKARVILFVSGGRPAGPDRAREPGGPAAGMTCVWSEEFDAPLAISSARQRDATWFAGGKPSATGSQYTDALFVTADDPRQPFFQQEGFLRIRAVHDPAMKDPSGWNRTWWSGHLATGFPDGTASIAMREGYAEIRMMLPAGDGTWPSFWMLDSANTLPNARHGEVEIDVMEGYGRDPRAYRVTEHRYPGRDPADAERADRSAHVAIPGNPNLFHVYGVRLTHSEVIWYLDGAEVFRAPLFRADVVSPFYFLIGLGMGGGWPSSPPPAGHYDLWIDYVRVYR